MDAANADDDRPNTGALLMQVLAPAVEELEARVVAVYESQQHLNQELERLSAGARSDLWRCIISTLIRNQYRKIRAANVCGTASGHGGKWQRWG